MLRTTIAACILTLATTWPAAAQQQAITHEDVWLSKRLSAPVLSPDGTWAAVQVTEPAYAETGQTSDLWLVASDGLP